MAQIPKHQTPKDKRPSGLSSHQQISVWWWAAQRENGRRILMTIPKGWRCSRNLRPVQLRRWGAPGRSAGAPADYLWGIARWTCVLGLGLGLTRVARAEVSSPELIQPFVCSSFKPAVPPKLKGICEITPLKEKRNRVKVRLTAKTSKIIVAGYRVETEHYNDAYLPPIIEAKPGDTVAARLENLLKPRAVIDLHSINTSARTQASPMAHGRGDKDENPTNLHYFHGGIVTPNNARPKPAEKGDGDNIYVRLQNGRDKAGKPRSFEYRVPIPGEDELDAGVLESTGTISHPNGLNWYHSHMHGRSSDQVMGGLSGLLSVGEDKANVRAKCPKNAPQSECDSDTAELKKRTIVRYALLRDISLREISAPPEQAATNKTARWAPEDRDFHPDLEHNPPQLPNKCEPEDRKLRKGFCQRSKDSAWLFTLNGQRFPKITIQGNRNLLLRIGNLSANVAYWLDLYNEATGVPLAMNILSLDGVVPAKPVPPGEAATIDATEVKDLLLMPASRAEIYVRNDICNDNCPEHEQHYILRTKELDAGTDRWPEVQLARVVLKPSKVAPKIALARNAPTQQDRITFLAEAQQAEAVPPQGCVRDLEKGEHRRVTFMDWGKTSDGRETAWSVATQIMRLKSGSVRSGDEDQDFESDPGAKIGDPVVGGIPFEDYVKADGNIDWLNKKHVCISLDTDEQSPSRQQLWVLRNRTGSLHNFHIHQMKFRLAKRSELKDKYHIVPKDPPSTCFPNPDCTEPDFKLYEKDEPETAQSYPLWHDTIPVPSGKSVYIIMSYTAKEQIGRYVFHCHILKHEDKGLMAPIEVWARFPGKLDR